MKWMSSYLPAVNLVACTGAPVAYYESPAGPVVPRSNQLSYRVQLLGFNHQSMYILAYCHVQVWVNIKILLASHLIE
jgi:hypothetical protein